MLHLSIDPKLVNAHSEITIKRAKKKIEKDLMLYPNARIFFQVEPKSKKQSTVALWVEFANQRLVQQEFSTKSWENALVQSVEHAIHTLKSEYPISKGAPRHYMQM